MTGERQSVPRPFAVYAVAVGCAGVGVLALSWNRASPPFSLVLVVLIVAALAAESLALELPSGGVYSLAYPLTMATAVMFGPAAAGLAAVCSTANIADLRHPKPALVYVFNAGQLALSACIAGWTYIVLGGPLPLVTVVDGRLEYQRLSAHVNVPSVLVPLLACAVVSIVLNDVLVSVGMHLFFRAPWTRVNAAEVGWMIPSQLVLAAVGFSLAAFVSISRGAVVFFIVPFLVARQVFQRYSGLRDAYLDTIRSLVAAIEAKDPYTRGHSERVTEYAGQLGAAIGMRQSELERLEYAALLHDVGKIGVPGRVLTKPGRLTEEEYARIKEHPRVGAQIVSRVPYLADTVEPILHHHEHFDGSGYGLGFAGVNIPRMARVLTVVDAFDAMTSARPYRPALSAEDATEELLRCSGTQFDPECVDAFAELVHSGSVVPESFDTTTAETEDV